MRALLMFHLFTFFTFTINAQGSLFSSIEMETVEINDSVFMHTGVITNTTGAALSGGQIIVRVRTGKLIEVQVSTSDHVYYSVKQIGNLTFVKNIFLLEGESISIKITTRNMIHRPRGGDLGFKFYGYSSNGDTHRASGQLKSPKVVIYEFHTELLKDDDERFIVIKWETECQENIAKYFLVTEVESLSGTTRSRRHIVTGAGYYKLIDQVKIPFGTYRYTLSYKTIGGDVIVWDKRTVKVRPIKIEGVIYRSNAGLAVETDHLLAVQIFDTMGRLISSQQVSQNATIQLPERVSEQIVIVRTIDEFGNRTTKKY